MKRDSRSSPSLGELTAGWRHRAHVQQRSELVRALEDRFVATSQLTHAQAIRLYESLWREARQLGIMPGSDPWEGIETDLRLARILATCSSNS
jgi:hypothetical protein